MSKYSMLDIVLSDILKAVTPSQQDWEIRLAIVSDLRTVADSVESLRGELSTSLVNALSPPPPFSFPLFILVQWKDFPLLYYSSYA